MFETVLFNIIKALSSVFEIVFAFILLSSFFDKKYISPWPQRVAFVLSAGIMFALQETGRIGEFKVLAEILLVLVISFTVYTGKKRDRVVFLLAFSLMLALADIMSAFALSWIADRAPFLERDAFFFRLLNLELPYLIMLAAVLLLCGFIRRKSEHIEFRYWIMLLTVPAITIITLTVFQFALQSLPEDEQIHNYIYAAAAGLLFITVLVFVLFSKLQNQLAIVRDNQEMKLQMDLQKQSVEKMETAYNHTRALRHDLKNHLRCLNGLLQSGDYDGARAYLKTMQSDIEDATYFAVSENSAVDAILNEKLLEAQNQQTNLRFEVASLKNTRANAVDLCIILSNALDNALEACAKIPDVEERFVTLKITESPESLVISVVNPVEKEPVRRGLTFVSTKKDGANHGIGLKSIRSTAEKYRGEVLARCEQKRFTLLVRLNFPEDSQKEQKTGQK